jgi:hypothetical protein
MLDFALVVGSVYSDPARAVGVRLRVAPIELEAGPQRFKGTGAAYKGLHTNTTHTFSIEANPGTLDADM